MGGSNSILLLDHRLAFSIRPAADVSPFAEKDIIVKRPGWAGRGASLCAFHCLAAHSGKEAGGGINPCPDLLLLLGVEIVAVFLRHF